MEGLIHIYCGDGKGKTTASVGLTVRAAGSGMPVVFSQFMKNDTSGELGALKEISNVTIEHTKSKFRFTFQMSEEEKVQANVEYRALFDKVTKLGIELCNISSKAYVLLVMDEIISAYNLEFVDRDSVLEFLRNKPKNLEVVLTGREPREELIELASYVSEVRMVKHPFEQGIPSRKGIEW